MRGCSSHQEEAVGYKMINGHYNAICFIIRRRQWHPSPVLLPGKSHGWRSLVGCSPWGRQESDTTERLHFHFSLSCTGEGHGNPLQCSCLENLRDRGAWWAAVYGVAQSRTRLKWLSMLHYLLDIWLKTPLVFTTHAVPPEWHHHLHVLLKPRCLGLADASFSLVFKIRLVTTFYYSVPKMLLKKFIGV